MSKEIPRIEVKEYSSSEVYFEGSLESTISMLQDFKNEGKWEGIEILYPEYDGRLEYYLYKYRLENDEEYSKRIKCLEKQEKIQNKEKQHRRELYEKLKLEFGNE